MTTRDSAVTVQTKPVTTRDNTVTDIITVTGFSRSDKKKVNVCILRPIVHGLVVDKKCQMKTKRFEAEPNDQLSGHYEEYEVDLVKYRCVPLPEWTGMDMITGMDIKFTGMDLYFPFSLFFFF